MLCTVSNGTGAGRKRALKPAATASWRCKCTIILQQPNGDNVVHKTNPPWLVACPACRTRRP